MSYTLSERISWWKIYYKSQTAEHESKIVSWELLPVYVQAFPYASTYISFDTEKEHVKARSLRVDFHVNDANSWPTRAAVFNELRRLIDEHGSVFNASAAEIDAIWFVLWQSIALTSACIHRYDLISAIPSLTGRTVLTTIASMSVICAIFVPTVVSVVTATATIVSINLSALTTLFPLSLIDTVQFSLVLCTATAPISIQYYCWTLSLR